jgi:hypothetical protein
VSSTFKLYFLMESKKINQLATELAPDLSDLTIIGDPTTGISKKITLSQMASLFTGTVEEYANLAAFPLVGVADTIYIALDTNILYRWNTGTSAYVELSPNIVSSLVFNDANGFDGTINLVGSVATLTITTALTTGSVPFIGASGALIQDNANLFFDDTNNRLGINTNAPTTALDVFGSGIIGRINGTSTNNAFLGFSSAGTNKWSIGNVQSDHRFRIYNEATTSELVSVLSTGEFGINIANPTTKFHIDGGASALIANLDANVSVAKSVSFRSDNSSRINLEVSGTESGSNAGADFFLRTFTDAGALIETPFTIVRSTGVTTIKSLTLTNALSIANGGTGSATQNFVDLTSIQTAAGAKTFSAITTISNATASTSTTTGGLVVTGGVGIGGALFGTTASFSSTLAVTGAATFTSTLLTGGDITVSKSGDSGLNLNSTTTNGVAVTRYKTTAAGNLWGTGINITAGDSRWEVYNFTLGASPFILSNAGAATFSSTIGTAGDITITKGSAASFIANNTSASGKSFRLVSTDTGKFIIQNTGVLDLVSITSGGYVGIGTTSPSHNLEIANTSGSTYIKLNADFGIGYVGMETADDSMRFVTASANPIQFYTSNVLRMTIAGGGAVSIVGSLSKGSGSFRIDHPLESMTETHQLVHSFVEAPQADLYYRGKIKLVNGKAQANIDEVATMTEGTFEALCREVQCFTTNESGWDLIKGKVIGNIIYIESQNANSTDEISWLVIGERKDKHIMETEWTDENGKVIVEPLKPIIEEQTIIEEAIIEEENPIIKEEEVIIEEKEVILEPKTI